MKTILILVLSLTCLNVFAAPRLRCSNIALLNFKGEVSDDTITTHGVKDGYRFECHDKKGNEYNVKVQGKGLAVKIIGDARTFTISCPFVKKENIYGTYSGIRLGAGGFLSFDLGVSFGKKGRTCFIGGVGAGLGAIAVVDKLVIADKWAAYDYNETVLVK